MPKLFIVTAGQAFTDIDALACAAAYAELLRYEHKKAKVILPGPFNNSITEEVISWVPHYDTELIDDNALFVVVDVSEPRQISHFVDQTKIIELFDHRFNNDDYWSDHGTSAKIEPVGSCATLIWEQFIKRGYDQKASNRAIKLLHVAVISNTLCLNAQITTDRDRLAAQQLEKQSGLDAAWFDHYYADQEKSLWTDLPLAIRNDTKIQPIPSLAQDIVIGQLEMWNGSGLIDRAGDVIDQTLSAYGNPDWFMNAISISEGNNYLFASNDKVQELLERAIEARFVGRVGQTDKLWLRKEILREIASTN